MKKLLFKILILFAIITFVSGCSLLFDDKDDTSTTQLSDLDAVSQDLVALDYGSITFAIGDTVASVSQNIGLPSAGTNGTTITWISSNLSFLGHNGIVTRPAYASGNTASVMLATVSKGTNSASKQFSFTIIRLDPSDLEAVNQDLATLDYGSIIYAPGDTAASVSQNIGLPSAGTNGTTITWISSNVTYLGHNGTVQQPDFGIGNLVITMVATVTKGTNSASKPMTFTVLRADPSDAGITETFTADNVSFNLVYVPGGLSFSIDTFSYTVTNAYWIGDSEVTWAMWHTVRTWATNYRIKNRGGAGTIDGETGPYDPPVPATENQPVSTISWRDAMVWANALTEWYNFHNGTSYTCVYYTDAAFTLPIRESANVGHDFTPGSQDNPYVNPNANGFRLLSNNEWELAARYQGTNSAYGAAEFPPGSGLYWTPRDYCSGSTAAWPDEAASNLVSWSGFNSGLSTHDVKGLAPNMLGVYDMSGNLEEWTGNLYDPVQPEYRWTRGGSFESSTQILQKYNTDVGYIDYWYGFRIGRSH